MKSAKIVAPARIEICEEAIPPTASNKILIRLQKAAICGSDLPYFSGNFAPENYPFPSGYPGHECLGIVEESVNENFKAGDRVMYYPEYLDAFKEYHSVSPTRLQIMPDGFKCNHLLITQLLGAVAHGVFRLDKPYGKTIVVMGQGPVGLLFTALLKKHGARKIIAVDPLDYRLETAKKIGADYVINPDTTDIEIAVPEMNDGLLADIVIDAFGRDVNVINTCFRLACHNGHVAFFGICLEESPMIDFNTMFRKELRMVASVGPDLALDYPYALDMIQTGAIDVSPLITHELPFDEIQTAFEMAAGRKDNVIKTILQF